ncbi:MAG: FtsW/RodA/SpoVE family cell cycle protein [Patescibacteria group bacterium]|nr:FtsW/RodA/SpoVE family cell cycle protein [Patescibacteria group bacterium]
MDQKLIILILINFMLISLTALFSLGKIDLFLKQFGYWVIGLILLVSGLFINYRFLFEKHYFYLTIFASLLILVLVLFVPGNIKSWFSIAGFSFQPSEFSKLGLFLLLTSFLTYHQADLINPFYLFLSFSYLLPYLALIILQPDWGMALLYFLIWLLVVLTFLSRKEIFFGFFVLALIFVIIWLFFLKDYQKQRILIFLNPDLDPLKSGYNLRQIRISLGTSDFWGKGVGLGEIGRLGFLPSAHTDFILTFLIEERGLFIFLFYSFFIFIILRELSKGERFNKNPLMRNFIFIVYQYLLAKYLITTLVNFGIFPIIGLPVPFLSYGGSHLIFDLWLLGMVFSFSKERV